MSWSIRSAAGQEISIVFSPLKFFSLSSARQENDGFTEAYTYNVTWLFFSRPLPL